MRFLTYLKCLLLVLMIDNSIEDIYMHNPRGSNNRLNEQSATRTNNNRLFDSQNNERGGYNVGDAGNSSAQVEADQYQMKYFQSGIAGKSYLTLEWTEQHGCGGNEDSDPTKQNCQLVLQYMCQDLVEDVNLDRLRDGLNTNSQDYTNMNIDSQTENMNRKQNNVKIERGLQEPWEWYDKCRYRERNLNLFTADQKLQNIEKGYSSAIFTRQNPNGNRNGYECAEERDYYPYWHPTLWKDMAVLTSNITLCDTYFKQNSFNIKPYHECVQFYNDTAKTRKHWSRYNNESSCKANNGRWAEFYNYLEKAPKYTSQTACESQTTVNINYKWATPYDSVNIDLKECLVILNQPDCLQADWSRSNHLGNTRDGHATNYTWALPYFPSNTAKKCVFRIRYNITTDDYDPFNTDSSSNQQKSAVKNNPLVNIGASNQPLRLAINTAQYGRVFQDRSHSFYLLPRKNNVQDDANIYNLNVRGKRGNIVQVYPAVEYDFIPNRLYLKKNDLVHIQWTGSNSHLNGPNGGDGATGNDGNGNAGTDRNNFVQTNSSNENFPLPFELTSFWNSVNTIGLVNSDLNLKDLTTYLKSKTINSKDLALYFSSSGYYECVKVATCNKSYDNMPKLDSDLNLSSASFSGAILSFTTSNKQFTYMCSRNNNFSNRSQKGSIIVN